MRAVLLSSALFAILVNLAAGGTLPQVSFQPHSYDDLRLWPQLFAKGARMVKVDPNFQTAAICAGQVNANRSDPRGCFLLNHDDPVAGPCLIFFICNLVLSV